MSDAVESIDAHEAKALLDRGEAVVVDVREFPEIAMSGTVPGALTIPMGELADKADPESPEFRRFPEFLLSKAPGRA